jgi:hypothetical protein
MDFSKFNSSIDLEGLKHDIDDASQNQQNFEEVPAGTYEVVVTKMELTESKHGDPMFTCWFKIIGAEQKGRLIFMNQVITQGFQIHIVNQLLRDMDTGIEIKFDDFSQYATLIFQIEEKLKADKCGFIINYGKTAKGFNTFAIKEVFDDALPF